MTTGGTDYQAMLSHLEANGVMEVPISLFDIDRRIKFGDADSGWRGDQSMGIFINPVTEQFEVWGIDRHGNEYKACSHPELSPEILIKLRDGDPTRGDPWQAVIEHNAKVVAEQEAVERDQFGVVAEKMQWAIRQDFAQHLGGKGGIHAIPSIPGPSEKEEVAQ